jgi:hypothetical protein
MRMLAGVIALFITGAASSHIHDKFPTAVAAGIDIVIFIILYLIIDRSIRAYLDE